MGSLRVTYFNSFLLIDEYKASYMYINCISASEYFKLTLTLACMERDPGDLVIIFDTHPVDFLGF